MKEDSKMALANTLLILGGFFIAPVLFFLWLKWLAILAGYLFGADFSHH